LGCGDWTSLLWARLRLPVELVAVFDGAAGGGVPRLVQSRLAGGGDWTRLVRARRRAQVEGFGLRPGGLCVRLQKTGPVGVGLRVETGPVVFGRRSASRLVQTAVQSRRPWGSWPLALFPEASSFAHGSAVSSRDVDLEAALSPNVAQRRPWHPVPLDLILSLRSANWRHQRREIGHLANPRLPTWLILFWRSWRMVGERRVST
jgi:hypothetical protein